MALPHFPAAKIVHATTRGGFTMDRPTSLTDAIDQLEKASQSRGKDIKDFVEKDFQEIRKAIADIKPYLNNLKTDVNRSISDSQKKVEEQIRENPWAAVGIVGFIAFLFGMLLGNGRR
jgi:ElaB/YqjD/DUF883 family membrane-anchored ribosome-binding protein